MYENIGGKIKGLAKAIFVIGTIISAIVGIGQIIAASAVSVGIGFFSGLLTVVIGFLGSWVSTWLLYGFGEIIDLLSINNARITLLHRAYCANHTTNVYNHKSEVQKTQEESNIQKNESPLRQILD